MTRIQLKSLLRLMELCLSFMLVALIAFRPESPAAINTLLPNAYGNVNQRRGELPTEPIEWLSIYPKGEVIVVEMATANGDSTQIEFPNPAGFSGHKTNLKAPPWPIGQLMVLTLEAKIKLDLLERVGEPSRSWKYTVPDDGEFKLKKLEP